MPRATLFKPPKREKLDKNPLWKEVYLGESSDNDSGSESEENDQEIFKMLKDTMIAKGITTDKKKKSNAQRKERVIATPQVRQSNNEDLTLPPIDAHKKSQVKIANQRKQLSVSKNKSIYWI